MANKYRKLMKKEPEAKVSPAAAVETNPNFVGTPPDLEAERKAREREVPWSEALANAPHNFAEAAKSVGRDIMGLPEGARAALEELPTAVPGGRFVTDKIRMALGETGEEIEAKRAQMQRESPVGTGIGEVASILTGGAVLPGAKAATIGGKLLAQAAQAAVIAPAYKLGEIADQAALKGDALHAEAIGNAFSFQDSLEAAGLTLALGLPMAGIEAAATIGQKAKARSVTEAAKLFPKAAEKLNTTPEAVGRTALDKGLLKSETATKKLMKEAGKRMSAAAQQAQFTGTEIDQMALDLAALEKNAQNNQFLVRARKDVRAQAARLLSVQSGAELEGIIQSMKQEARAAYAAGKAQKGQFYGDAAETLRQGMEKHLDVLNPQVGAEYRAATQDYNTYVKMLGEAQRGASKQLKASQVAQTIGRAAVAPVLGSAIGGPVGMAAGMVLDITMPRGILSPVRGKNTAVFMDKLSKIAPGAQHQQRAAQVVESLLGVAKLGTVALGVNDQHPEREAEKDVPKKYAGVAKALRSSMADPTGVAQRIREQLDFLPPHVADAVAANSMNKLQSLALTLPPETGPATAFGITTDVPDRAKREFLRRAQDAFDPYGAVLSGSPMRVREAEKYNPETINDLRKRVIEKIAENPKLPYSTKRRVAGILGVAGVPTQDPMVGATVQQILRKRREAQDSQGQMKSARQMNANLKQNSATLTRAQKILNNGE